VVPANANRCTNGAGLVSISMSGPLQRMKHLLTPLPIVLVMAWLGVVALGVWSYAAVELEPPSFDVMTYANKAFSFWDSLKHGKIVNPLNIEPTNRAPGTILLSYPLGFTSDFRGFYFRSIFIPIVLLVVAAYIAGYSSDGRKTPPWIVAVVALTLGGMPDLYQFQASDTVPTTNFWGLVDTFLAGSAAVAVAAAGRSVKMLSLRWSIIAALVASLCLMIKPAGLLVIPLVGATWLILMGSRIEWNPARLAGDPEIRRFAGISLSVATLVFVTALVAAFSSKYLSARNIAFASAAFAGAQQDFVSSFDPAMVLWLVRLSLGYVVPVTVAAGLVGAAIMRGGIGAALAAALCLAVGEWLCITTVVTEIRFFLPFGVMAFVIVQPWLVLMLRSLPVPIGMLLAAVMLVPTAAETALLLLPSHSAALQRLLGVNLASAAYRAEDEQAAAFLKMLVDRDTRSASVYSLATGSSDRNFIGVVSYRTFLDHSLPRVSIRIPIDWQRSATYRLEEIWESDYVAFEPIRDDAQREMIVKWPTVPDFGAEMTLMRAWFSTLGPEDGVTVVSETRLRLLRVADHARFDRALERLRSGYNWRPAFHAANPRLWWSEEELAEFAQHAPVIRSAICFANDDGARVICVHALSITTEPLTIDADFWLEPQGAAPIGDWLLFVQLLGADGSVLASSGAPVGRFSHLSKDRSLKLHAVSIPAVQSTAIAFGIYLPGEQAAKFLIADHGRRDSDGRRVLLSLPAR
jgi:hypothetical protein